MSGDIGKYLELITTEHRNQPRYIQTISIALRAIADIADLAENLYSYFDVDSAIGKQLDVVGQWTGASRILKTALPNVYFSLDTPGLGLDQGTWRQTFDPITGLTELTDYHYRILIKAKIIGNQWDGTTDNAYEAWNALFVDEGYNILIQDGTPAKTPFFEADPTTILESLDYGSWYPGGSQDYKITGGMAIIIALIAPYEAPLPSLVYFSLDAENAGLDIGYLDITPQPIAEPSIDAVTLALFKDGYFGLKPAGVSVEYAIQSYRGMPIFALDVDNSDIESAPPTYLAGMDQGAWAVIF